LWRALCSESCKWGSRMRLYIYIVIINLVHPYIIAGQIATAYYFFHYIGITPLIGIIDNVLSTIGSNWVDLPEPQKKENWRILLEGNPARMTNIEKELWLKAKKDILASNIVISPKVIGGSLV
jgi:hypothetical protein